MMMWDINSLSTPINKNAAVVTNNPKDLALSKFLSASQDLENMRAAIKSLSNLIDNCKDKAERKDLIYKRMALQEKISPLKEKVKMLNIKKRSTVNELIIQECMKTLSKAEWDIISKEANRKFRLMESEEC